MYKSQQKTHTDSTFGAPVPDSNPVVDSSKLVDIKLNKKIYGVKGALDKLDEEFKHFLPSGFDINRFFRLYNRNFYELPKAFHSHFIHKSLPYAYPDGYENPRLIEQEELIKELIELKREVDSVEREHFFFKNNSFVMDDTFKNNPTGILSSGGNVYYMQSARRREIKDFQTYKNLKTRIRKKLGIIDDQDFIMFISTDALMGIPKGPDINTLEDINRSSLEINIYPQTMSEYEDDLINNTH